MKMERPKYIRADLLVKEYKNRVTDCEKLDSSEYLTILAMLEEELILKLAETIKRERKNEKSVKSFGI